MPRVNVEGTRAVLDAAARGGVRRVVMTSSCATCGPVPGRPATEDGPSAGVGAGHRLQALEDRLRGAGPAGGARRARRGRRQPDDAGRARATRGPRRRARWSQGSRRGGSARSRRRRSTSSTCVTSRAGHLLAFERGRRGRALPARRRGPDAARRLRDDRTPRRAHAAAARRALPRRARCGLGRRPLDARDRPRAEAAQSRRDAPGACADAVLAARRPSASWATRSGRPTRRCTTPSRGSPAHSPASTSEATA